MPERYKERSAAYHFLVYYSFITEHYPNEQGTEVLDRITVISSLGANLTQYLIRYPYSSTWKLYAKGISSIRCNGYVSHESELEHFFVRMKTYKKSDFAKKINFIKKLKVYKDSSVNFKINAAEKLMLCHPKQGTKILKKAYKNANSIIQSNLLARYPDIFEYDENHWVQVLLESNENAQNLINHNFDKMKV
jgi:hypothetical protein